MSCLSPSPWARDEKEEVYPKHSCLLESPSQRNALREKLHVSVRNSLPCLHLREAAKLSFKDVVNQCNEVIKKSSNISSVEWCLGLTPAGTAGFQRSCRSRSVGGDGKQVPEWVSSITESTAELSCRGRTCKTRNT